VALLSQRSTSSLAIKVGTTDGVVTLSGIAKNVAEKTLVTRHATDITGVKSVINNMTIGPTLSESGLRPSSPKNLRVVSTSN
jgi:osmotically-inducible protein OsmY